MSFLNDSVAHWTITHDTLEWKNAFILLGHFSVFFYVKIGAEHHEKNEAKQHDTTFVATVYDAGPTFKQNWIDVLCLQGWHSLCQSRRAWCLTYFTSW